MRTPIFKLFLGFTVVIMAFAAQISVVSAQDQKSNSICVKNAAKIAHYFTIDAGDGRRDLKSLQPQESLCIDIKAGEKLNEPFVSVFKSLEELEGCSRLVKVGETEVLVEYADFDRCTWEGNRL